MTFRPPPSLLSLSRSGLPSWCDQFLDLPSSGNLFATRLWYEVTLAAALPTSSEPLLARSEAILLPMLREGRRLRNLVTDYTLAWRPLLTRDADVEALRASGRALGRLFRLRQPAQFDAVEDGALGLAPLLDGLRSAGVVAARYAHFGNWYEPLAPGTGWDAYFEARPSELRTTIQRKLVRARQKLRLEIIAAPGHALEAGVAAYEEVRARSWKPHEPSPTFDGVLMRALAAAGALRLGVLREQDNDQPVAAQYWALDRGGTDGQQRAMVLKLAHVEEKRAASPGTVLTTLMVRKLIEEDGVRELDFGRGDDAYKRLWASARRQRFGYLLADPRHPVGLLALARQAAGTARRHLLRLRSAAA
jgi:hypothetical protein